jgi:regulator of protease activity HflC (stomatin/prohibitin superfamily)
MNLSTQKKVLDRPSIGLTILVVNVLLILLSFALFLFGIVADIPGSICAVVITLGALYGFIIGPILFGGLKIIKPNDALVLTLLCQYHGTLKKEGFFFVNPFVTAVKPASSENFSGSYKLEGKPGANKSGTTAYSIQIPKRKLSLKAMTLNNEKQKINDSQGNPIIIGVVVIWKVVDTAKTVFDVDNYVDYLSIQCDSALRNVVRLFPYDSDDDEKSLRGSSREVAEDLRKKLQGKVFVAGLGILGARITHLSYAPEIAAAMLQLQQSSAIIAARQKLWRERLDESEIVNLDEERKASLVSNLLVVLCENKEVQPIVYSGSLY